MDFPDPCKYSDLREYRYWRFKAANSGIVGQVYDDLFHDTMVDAWLSFEESKCAFETYLNWCLKAALQKARRQKRRQQSIMATATQLARYGSDMHMDPEVVWSRVCAGMARLFEQVSGPKTQRGLLYARLRINERKSLEQIAQQCGVTKQGVYYSLLYFGRRLRDFARTEQGRQLCVALFITEDEQYILQYILYQLL